jgi:chromosome segregation ATPase
MAGNVETVTLVEATSFAEIERQANQLLDYISKLSSFADRACDTAIRQTESAQRIEDFHNSEMADLRAELERTAAALENSHREHKDLEHKFRDQIIEIENLLRERDTQLNERDIELKHLRAEITCLLSRLNDAEETVKQAESGLHDRIDPLTHEIAALKSQLAQRDEIIQAKNAALRKVDADHRAATVELEQRKAKWKRRGAVASGTTKKKMPSSRPRRQRGGDRQMIKRLSTSVKSQRGVAGKKRDFSTSWRGKPQAATEGKVWRRVIGRLQEDGLDPLREISIAPFI